MAKRQKKISKFDQPHSLVFLKGPMRSAKRHLARLNVTPFQCVRDLDVIICAVSCTQGEKVRAAGGRRQKFGVDKWTADIPTKKTAKPGNFLKIQNNRCSRSL